MLSISTRLVVLVSVDSGERVASPVEGVVVGAPADPIPGGAHKAGLDGVASNVGVGFPEVVVLDDDFIIVVSLPKTSLAAKGRR